MQKRSIRERLITGTIYLFLDWIVVTSIGFFFWFILGKNLTPKEYGYVTIGTNLMMILSGISLVGLWTANYKLIPEYLKTDRKKVNSLVRFSIMIVFITNSILVLILVISSSFMSDVLKIPPAVIFISCAGLFLISLTRILASVYRGFQNMKKIFLTDLSGMIIKLFFTFILVFLGFKYLGGLIGFVACYAVISLLRIDKNWFKTQNNLNNLDKKEIIVEYAFPAFVASLANLTFNNAQYILLPILENPEITGIFGVSMILTSLISIVPVTLNYSLFPIISELSVSLGTKKRQAYLVNQVMRYSMLLVFPLVIFLSFFSKPIILLFTSERYLRASEVLPILSLAAIFVGFGSVLVSSLYALGKTKTHRNIMVFNSILFLILAIFLTRRFSYFGMSYAWFFSAFLFFLISFFCLRKLLKIRLNVDSLLKILFSSVVFFFICYFIDLLGIKIPLKILLVGFAGFLYLIILSFLRFYTREDIKVIEFFAERSPLFREKLYKLSKFISKFIKS